MQTSDEQSPDADSDKSQDAADEEILRIARERFDLAVDAESEIRREALDDLKFSSGEQWPDDVKSSRELDRRPCLTINRLPQFVRQVTNDQKQNRPAIKVSPVDDDGDVETAKILQGMIRHIEHASDADIAYDTAFECAVRASFGFFRIVSEYVDSMSFVQELRFKRVRNQFSVYLDPNSQQPDGSDSNWGFVFEDMNRDEYEAQYPSSKLAAMDDWSSIGNSKPGWMAEKTCRVAEYYYKEFKETTIVQLTDGSTGDKATLPAKLPPGIKVVAERKSLVPKVMHLKINGVEVLERTECFTDKWIPIIPVLGEELDIDGERKLESVIRHAKDSQRMYNYWKSSETETIALAPRAPFIGVEGQFEGYENQWREANVRNHAFLQYKAKTIGGQPAPPPQRNVFEPPIQAISQASAMAAEDLKATTGIYDASLGNRSNEQSGIAIQRRNSQSQTSNFHFLDNLTKSIRHAGRILVDGIPRIYDTPRAVRVLGEEGTEEIVKINQIFEHKGKPTEFQLGIGRYDVTISSGPSFETKRQEAVASMADMSKSNPQLMQVAGDLMVKNMDWPGAQEIAERIRKTLPPGIAEDDKSQQQPIPPAAQQQMQQMGQMIDQLTTHLKQKTEQIQTKSLELESRERIEAMKVQAQIEIAMAQMGSKESMALLAHQVEEISQRMALLHASQPIDQEMSDGAGPQGAAMPSQMQPQQPTGGQPPGSNMEMNHGD